MSEHNGNNKPMVVLVHGAWLTRRSWENFVPYFEQKDY